MCQPEALERLKSLHIKYEPLYCLGSTQCWCAKVSYVLPMPSVTSECMSPSKLLEIAELSLEDRRYLNSIKHRELIF